MKRKQEGVVRWRKEGKGSFRMANGKIIKPGQVFTAKEEDIPIGFRDVIIPLDKLPEQEEIIPVKLDYSLVPTGDSDGLFNIISANGKKLNEQSLTRIKALEMIKDLE